MRLLLGRAFTLFLLGSSLPLLSAQVIETAQGKLAGMRQPNSLVTVFEGIPFAAPPVGDLRWRAPQPPAPWQGVRKANEFGASCMQIKAGERLPWTREFMVQNEISEDCLFLNVWTPRLEASAHLPVIVYIHGGEFSEGSGAVEVYWGTNLAAKGTVVVTINYRLGVFGFLAHPELTAESEHHASGNYGLMDQIAALRWVRENIVKFGGDPHNVTIWGQSAGAFSVAALVASPEAHGWFQHAQADSGVGVTGLPMASLSAGEENGVKFAKEHNAASIKELRALPADALMPDPKAMMTGGLRFTPIVDGWIVPDTPNNMNEKGNDNDVSFLTGYQAGDSALFNPPLKSFNDYRQMVQRRYGNLATEYDKLYPAYSLDDARKVIGQVGQDRNRVSMYL